MIIFLHTPAENVFFLPVTSFASRKENPCDKDRNTFVFGRLNTVILTFVWLKSTENEVGRAGQKKSIKRDKRNAKRNNNNYSIYMFNFNAVCRRKDLLDFISFNGTERRAFHQINIKHFL